MIAAAEQAPVSGAVSGAVPATPSAAGGAEIELRPVESAADRRRWDEYIEARPDSLYTDTTAWREAIAEAFGLDDLYLLAWRGERVTGAAGITLVRGALTGRHATSGPLSSSGGGLYAEDVETLAALLERLEREVSARRLRYAVLPRTELFERPGWQVDRSYSTYSLPLGPDSEAVWSEVLASNSRRQVRRAQRHPFTFELGDEQFDPFLKVLHRGIKELGSPFPGRPLFQLCRERFALGGVEFATLRLGGEPVAACVLFFHRDTVAVPWIRTLKAYNRYAANSLLYWEVIRRGCERGMRRLDLGRSRVGSSNAGFKRRYGATARPLYYHYRSARPASRLPDLDPSALRFRLAAAVWRALPDSVTRRWGLRAMRELI